MLVPEFLYKLTPRDEQVTPLEVVSQRLTGTANNTTVSTSSYTIPKGKVLCISNWVLRTSVSNLTGGLPVRVMAFGDPNDSSAAVGFGTINGADISASVTDAADLNKTQGASSGVVYIPENHTVYAQATFSSADASNTVDLQFWGVLIPRGNFAI